MWIDCVQWNSEPSFLSGWNTVNAMFSPRQTPRSPALSNPLVNNRKFTPNEGKATTTNKQQTAPHATLSAVDADCTWTHRLQRGR